MAAISLAELVLRVGAPLPFELPDRTAFGPFTWDPGTIGASATAIDLKAVLTQVDPVWQLQGGTSATAALCLLVVGYRLKWAPTSAIGAAPSPDAIAEFESKAYINHQSGKTTTRLNFANCMESYTSHSMVANDATGTNIIGKWSRNAPIRRLVNPLEVDFQNDATFTLQDANTGLSGVQGYIEFYGLCYPNDSALKDQGIRADVLERIMQMNGGGFIPTAQQ